MNETMQRIAYRGAGNAVFEEALRAALRERTLKSDWPHDIGEAMAQIAATVDHTIQFVNQFYDGVQSVECTDIREAAIKIIVATLRAILETPLGK